MILGDDKVGDLKLQAHVDSAAGRQESVVLQYGAAVELGRAAAEAVRCVFFLVVYLVLEVGAIAAPFLVMSDWAAQVRFSLRGTIQLEALTGAVAGWTFVAAVLEVIPPFAGEGVRRGGFELAADVALLVSEPFRCLCSVATQ
jgi:hypothetical protein